MSEPSAAAAPDPRPYGRPWRGRPPAALALAVGLVVVVAIRDRVGGGAYDTRTRWRSGPPRARITPSVAEPGTAIGT